MRTMYDAANILNIPRSARLIGYYDDGRYVPSASDMRQFPDALFVPITVFASDNRGIVFDGPPDNSTWPAVVGWVVMRRKAGADPTVYTDNDQWPVARRIFAQQGVPEPHWWIADWNGNSSIPPGAIGHQYRGNQTGGFDLSVIADYWPGVDPPGGAAPASAPITVPAPIEEDDVLIVNVTPDPANPNGNPGIWLLSGSLYVGMATPDDVQSMLNAGVKQVTWDFSQHQRTLAAAAALHGTLSGSLGVSGNLTVG